MPARPVVLGGWRPDAAAPAGHDGLHDLGSRAAALAATAETAAASAAATHEPAEFAASRAASTRPPGPLEGLIGFVEGFVGERVKLVGAEERVVVSLFRRGGRLRLAQRNERPGIGGRAGCGLPAGPPKQGDHRPAGLAAFAGRAELVSHPVPAAIAKRARLGPRHPAARLSSPWPPCPTALRSERLRRARRVVFGLGCGLARDIADGCLGHVRDGGAGNLGVVYGPDCWRAGPPWRPAVARKPAGARAEAPEQAACREAGAAWRPALRRPLLRRCRRCRNLRRIRRHGAGSRGTGRRLLGSARPWRIGEGSGLAGRCSTGCTASERRRVERASRPTVRSERRSRAPGRSASASDEPARPCRSLSRNGSGSTAEREPPIWSGLQSFHPAARGRADARRNADPA